MNLTFMMVAVYYTGFFTSTAVIERPQMFATQEACSAMVTEYKATHRGSAACINFSNGQLSLVEKKP